MSGPNFSYAGWSLTFDDEFNSLSLYNGTSGTWQTDYYNGDRTLFGNGELETYVDPSYAGNSDAPLGLNPFSIDNGILTITAQPTPPADLSALNNIPYTSGLLTTESSFAQLYGYFEIRAEVPAGQGLWPAFWLLPLDKSWPPEIDAMEILGQDPTQVYHGSRAVDSSLNTGGSYTGIDASTGFHTYGVEWEPSGITWYIDGVEVGTAPNSSNTPMYMLTNLAVGGNWSGAPDSTTPFPAGYQVDYIRAYTLDGGPGGPVPVDGSTPTPTPAPTPAPVGPNATPDEPRQYVSVDSNGIAFGTSSPSDLFNNADGQTLIGNGGDDVFHIGTYVDTTIVENGTGVSTVSTWAPVYTLQSGISDLTAAGGGSFTLTGNSGDNVITGNSGNDTLDGGGGQDILVGGGGDDAFVMHAGYGALTIADWQGGTGPSDTVQLVGFGITDFSTVQADLTQNGNDALLMLGPGDSITFSNKTVDSFTANDFTFVNASPSPAPTPTPAGSGPVATPTEARQYVSVDSTGVATGATSPADLYNNADGQTLIGNGGDDIFHVGTYTDTTIVENGTGISTVSTWAPVYTLQAGISDLTANGGGAFTLTGNAGDNVITGGTGNDTLDGGGGEDMLTGDGGDDTFVMRQGYGDTTITDFGTTADVVQLVNYGFTDFADVQAAMTQSGNDAVLTLTDGSTLTFQNVTVGSFVAADFALSGGAAASPSPAPSPAATPLPTGAFTPTPDEGRNYIAPDSTGVAQGTSGDDDLFATGNNQTLIGNGGNDVFHLGTDTGVVVSETGTGTSEVSTWGSQYVLATGFSNLTGDGGASHTLTGNAAANVITGDTGNDVLNGGGGSDLLIGGGGTDTYQFAGSGQDTIVNGNGSGAASGELDLGTGIANNQLWLMQSGNDLQIDVMGTSNQVTIAGWYSSPAAQLQSIRTASGSVLDAQIGQLVQAMASFQSANPGFDPTQVAQAPNDPSLQSAIAASWHS